MVRLTASFAWPLLAASIVAEVAGNAALRHADGFARPAPTLGALACYGLAIWLMSLSLRHLAVGLAYAVWAGAGTALTAAIGMLWWNEPAAPLRFAGIAFIVAGVAALNVEV